jgi:hypothetical protein
MPVSREQFLLKVFASLELLECDRERTGLLVYVDGDAELYLTAHNLAEQSKFAERHCVQGNIPGERKEFSINTRRRRISAVHNATRKLINPCEYVFLIEDDGVLPPDALSRLLADYLAHPYAGFIEGVELGRWGIPHVGAWRADDVYDMKRLESAMPGSGVEEIDAGGLYACLTRFRQYVEHEFQPYEGCAFGPDIEWGIALRRQGYRNYLDWSLGVEHCRPDGTSLHPRAMRVTQMRFTRRSNETWQADLGDQISEMADI